MEGLGDSGRVFDGIGFCEILNLKFRFGGRVLARVLAAILQTLSFIL